MPPEPAFSHPLRIALVGAGNVGTAVAKILRRRGHEVTAVWSRSPDSAARAAAALKAPVAASPGAAVEDATLVLVGVVDRAVAEVAEQLAPAVSAGAVVAHFAGASGTAPLAPIETSGAHPAALHPVQSVPDLDSGVRQLPGSAWGVTCAPEVRAWVHDLLHTELGGVPVDVAEEDRGLWHAAAVMTSNGIAALMSMGAALLAGLGVQDPQAVLGPLAYGTTANVRALGAGGDALTGPVVRGDGATIERHLSELEARFPELRDEYRLIGRAIVASATRTARIDADAARVLNGLLDTV